MSVDKLARDRAELYDGAACGLLSTGQDGTIQQVNRTFCDWIGLPRNELIGARKLQDLLTVGGKIFHQTHWMPLLEIQGSVAEIALEMVHASGRKVPMLLNAIRREHDGVVSHHVAVFISEDRHAYEREIVRARKQAEDALAAQVHSQRALELAEERLRLAVEAAQLCLWEADAADGERVFDDRTALLLGYPAPRAIDVDEFTAAVGAPGVPLPAPADGEPPGLYRREYRITGVDGIARTILETGRALRSPEQPGRHVAVLQDITAIALQRAAAEERAQFAQQMMGIVSHDLRNPLSAIMLALGMLLRTPLDERQGRYAEGALQATHRAQRLIGDLLDFTSAKLGRGITVNMAAVDLQELVARCVEELSMAFPDRSIRHLARGTGACAADADRLAQLIGNLVSNALKYGASDSTVTVTSDIRPTEFSVTVHNEGEPIAPEQMAHLFEPMSQGTQEHGPDRSVGLGLFIVQEIARGHGGRVSVVSTREAGTRFTLRVPRGASA